MALTLIFTYNSLTSAWTHTYAASLAEQTNGDVIYTDGDGTQHLFAAQGSGNYNAPGGLYDTLVKNADNTFTLTHIDQTAHEFDASGKLTALHDRHSNTVTLTYAGNELTAVQAAGGQTLTFAYTDGDLTSVTNNANHSMQLTWNGGGRITDISDPLNFTTQFSYSGGHLHTLTDPRANLTTFGYDANDRITDVSARATFGYTASTTTVTDENNHATTYALNNSGHVTQATDARNGVTSYTYDANFNALTITDPLAHTTTMTYDAGGNLLTRTNALNQTTTYTYNAQNDLTSVTDPLNHTTTYVYTDGNLTSVTDPLNHTTTYGYNNFGQRTNVTDANNHVTIYGYNTEGELVTVTDHLNHTTTYGYDSVGNRTSVTNARNNATTYVYDANNRLTETHAPLNANTTYSYDANGNRTSVTDANNHTTTYAYDAFNQQISTTDALNHSFTQSYDTAGNRISLTDANNHTTTYTYDELNRLVSITDALNHTTQLGYDAAGNRVSITDPLNHTTTFGYDAANRLTSTTDAANHTTTYGYDNVGNRTSVTDAANKTTTYGYNEVNRVTSITNPTNKTQTFSYDAVGNRLTETDEANQTTTFAYDALNRLTTKTNPRSETTTYGYDTAGNVLTVTDAGNNVLTYAYNARDQLTSKTTGIGTKQFGYDDAGNLTLVTDPSGATSTFGYDAANRVTGQTDRNANQTLTVGYVFGYDETNNRTSQTQARPNRPDQTTTYEFDDLNRNISATDPYNNTTSYTYDAASNLTNTTDALGISTNVTPNAVNLPETITRTQNGSALDTTTNTYDPRNLLQTAATAAPYPTWNLNLVTTNSCNDNGYLEARQNSDQGIYSGSFSNGVGYTDHNLAQTVSGYGFGDFVTVYDGENRVNCNQNGGVAPQWWTYYPNGNRKYHYYGYGSTYCVPTDEPGQWWNAARDEYYYDGQKLMRVEHHSWRPDVQNSWYYGKSEFGYDGAGNLQTETQFDSSDTQTATIHYGWNYEAGANRLTSFTAASGITTTLEYDALGRIAHRATAQGASDYVYVGDSDWLLKETWHSSLSGNTFDLVQYDYVNGAPFRIKVTAANGDLSQLNGYTTYYLQMNWHGDAMILVGTQGDASNNYNINYDTWGGNALPHANPRNYYGWNAQWGYQYFADLQLYYAHGRWWRADIGIFLSPSEESGEYRYGSGQDAVNEAWDAISNFAAGATCQFVNDETLGATDSRHRLRRPDLAGLVGVAPLQALYKPRAGPSQKTVPHARFCFPISLFEIAVR